MYLILENCASFGKKQSIKEKWFNSFIFKREQKSIRREQHYHIWQLPNMVMFKWEGKLWKNLRLVQSILNW